MEIDMLFRMCHVGLKACDALFQNGDLQRELSDNLISKYIPLAQEIILIARINRTRADLRNIN